MTWRRAAAYWIGFGALLVFYMTAVREAEPPPAAHLNRAAFLTISEAAVTGLEVRRDDTVVRCQRADDRWHVTEPAHASAPSDLIAALVSNLAQLRDVEVVDEGKGNLASFGLDPPASRVVLSRSDGPPIELELGAANPAGTAIYAQHTDSPRVYLVGLNVRYYEDLLFESVKR
jgi:hypothetical protein